MARYALTTFDNPFDPFEQFTSWFMFDEEKGSGDRRHWRRRTRGWQPDPLSCLYRGRV